MSDSTQLTDQAAQLLGDLRKMLEAGGQFVVEQAPPLAKEMLTYGRFYNLVELALEIAIFTVGVRWYIKKFAAYKKESSNYDFPARPLAFGAITGLSCLAGFFTLSGLAKAWLAPRLYILEYVTSLLPGGHCK